MSNGREIETEIQRGLDRLQCVDPADSPEVHYYGFWCDRFSLCGAEAILVLRFGGVRWFCFSPCAGLIPWRAGGGVAGTDGGAAGPGGSWRWKRRRGRVPRRVPGSSGLPLRSATHAVGRGCSSAVGGGGGGGGGGCAAERPRLGCPDWMALSDDM